MDLKEVERVLELMKQHDLVEVELEDPEKGTRIRLRKAGAETNSHPVVTPTIAIPATAAEIAPVANPTPVAEAGQEEDRANLMEVPSPMVGTFYRAPSPDADPFVEVGDTIDLESVVCIIEAMKVMNEIKAEVAGEVVEILVQNGEAVEFGQPLFLIRTS
ncbi:MAG: acetyl-CoA carboxylase biotin carboxyl carrier protein [Planctomycetota bacterium]|jgi:acetyl-CoA carboxylase biotin carboxyl carrier protein